MAKLQINKIAQLGRDPVFCVYIIYIYIYILYIEKFLAIEGRRRTDSANVDHDFHSKCEFVWETWVPKRHKGCYTNNISNSNNQNKNVRKKVLSVHEKVIWGSKHLNRVLFTCESNILFAFPRPLAFPFRRLLDPLGLCKNISPTTKVV